MGRKATWPPRLTRHRSGNARVCWRGADHYLGPWGDDPANACEAAKAAYRELLDQLERQPKEKTRPVSCLLVCEAVERWQSEEGQRYQGVEADHYRRALGALVEVAGNVRVADFGVAHLERVRRTMVARNWSAGLINRRTTRIRGVWRWLELMGLAPKGSWEHLRALPGIQPNDRRVRHTKRRQPAAWIDVARVCRWAPPAVRAMILIGWFSGARPGEICQMRPADIDQSDPKCWFFRPRQHKCLWRGQDRLVPLGPVCQKVLRPFLDACPSPESYLFVPSRSRTRRLLHFTSGTLSAAVRRAAKRARVRLTCYQLRHAYRLRISRELGLDAARAAMGHVSIETTNEYAAGVDLELARKAARKAG